MTLADLNRQTCALSHLNKCRAFGIGHGSLVTHLLQTVHASFEPLHKRLRIFHRKSMELDRTSLFRHYTKDGIANAKQLYGTFLNQSSQSVNDLICVAASFFLGRLANDVRRRRNFFSRRLTRPTQATHVFHLGLEHWFCRSNHQFNPNAAAICSWIVKCCPSQS